jgi:murein DD-endopeptidase MepM/ murein hydrolase activator NlpD
MAKRATVSSTIAGIVVAGLAFPGCSGEEATEPADQPPPPAEPRETAPFFLKPFDGEFVLTNFFDHDLPFQFEDQNGFQLTWWGERTQGIDGHSGYDWVMPEGTPLYAAASGEVLHAGADPPFFCPPLNRTVSLQLFIEILHVASNAERFSSVYTHVSQIDVRPGQIVRAGQQIALSGNTGCSTEPHLHFHVWRHTNTNSGEPTRVDPFGWDGAAPDPWAGHSQGAESEWLWQDGETPPVYREVSAPITSAPATEAAGITRIRWMGYDDHQNPNNEFVEITLNAPVASSDRLDLTGFRLRDMAGNAFDFPDAFVIQEGMPVRVYTGSGSNTEPELYWGLSEGVWDNMGDCAHLLGPDGTDLHRLSFGGVCEEG